MSTKPPPETTYTVLTAEEWTARVKESARMAADLLPGLVDSCGGPGPAVLAALITARSLCVSEPRLPSFEWYCARVLELELGGLAGRREGNN